jgi:hypothetical protein
MTLALVVQVPEAKAAKQAISFAVSQSGITAVFNVEGSLDDASVAPGGSATVQAGISKKTFSITLDLSNYGLGTHTYGPFDTPIGTVSLPVAIGVNVDITGHIEGSIATTGNGSVSPNNPSWSTWGSQAITVDASQAKDGDTIGLTMSLSYVASIGVSVPIMGRVIDVHLPGVPGSTPITANIRVSSASTIPWFYVEIAIVLLVVVIIVGAILHQKKRGSKRTHAVVSPPAPPTSHLVSYCRYCGNPNRPNSKFCGKCGKRLS